MPIYEFACNKCRVVIGEIRNIQDSDKPMKCSLCGKRMRKIFSQTAAHVFKAQDLNLTITDRNTGNEKVLHAGNKRQLFDAINRYNDTPEAAKTGKVAVFEKLSVREV